jgi:hypothetical protein
MACAASTWRRRRHHVLRRDSLRVRAASRWCCLEPAVAAAWVAEQQRRSVRMTRGGEFSPPRIPCKPRIETARRGGPFLGYYREERTGEHRGPMRNSAWLSHTETARDRSTPPEPVSDWRTTGALPSARAPAAAREDGRNDADRSRSPQGSRCRRGARRNRADDSRLDRPRPPAGGATRREGSRGPGRRARPAAAAPTRSSTAKTAQLRPSPELPTPAARQLRGPRFGPRRPQNAR